MSSGFFIRSKRKLGSSKSNRDKSIKRSRVQDQSKKRKANKRTNVAENEEIFSSDEEISDVESHKSLVDEDEPITAQEKKLQLAKKYLEEIEREERERLENSEVNADVLASRLKEDALSQAGRLRKKVADNLHTVNEHNIFTLRNKDHNLSVTCVIISSDSKYIYSASKDGFIVKWDIIQKQKVKSISSAHKLKDKSKVGHDGVVLCLAISFDNRFLVSGDVKSIIHVWNPDTLTHIHCFKNHSSAITGLAICRDSNTLYSSSNDRSIKVWNLEEMMYVETLFGHQSPATSIDVLCKDRAVSSGSVDNSVHVWKIQDESQLIFNGSGRTIDVVRRIDDNHFITCGEDGLVSLWGVTKKKPINTISNAHDLDDITKEPNWVISVASLPMSDVFATGSSNGCVKLWKNEENFKTASLLFSIPVKGFINSIAFSLDENYLILGVGQEHKLGRWNRIAEARNSVVIVELKKKNGINGPKPQKANKLTIK